MLGLSPHKESKDKEQQASSQTQLSPNKKTQQETKFHLNLPLNQNEESDGLNWDKEID